MVNFPSSMDDDSTLPSVFDNITEIGGEAINAVRDAVFAIETEIGIGASGSAGSIADRLGVSLEASGAIKPSAIASMGLVTLPIDNSQIDDNAQILESKLLLDYRTGDLFNYIRSLSADVKTATGWISATGVKLTPHLLGTAYGHYLNQISVSSSISNYLTNRFRTYRNNTNSYTVLNDLNSELLSHQFADGTYVTASSITTNSGASFSANYAHPGTGVFLDTSRFAVIPGTTQDIQLLADYIDQSSIWLLGTRIQNLYSNGVSRSSRSVSFSSSTSGTNIVPITPAITYLSSTAPTDDINTGDDIIKFQPTAGILATNIFDSQFVSVKTGDIINVDYGPVQASFVIREKKYVQTGGSGEYIVRIDGKNLYSTATAIASINKPLFNNNKSGVLAVASANNLGGFSMPSLIVGNPRSAMALGLGFNPDLLDSSHYLLYLVLYPTGNPQDGYVRLPAIDVTGNLGLTPGKYTLDTVVSAINDQFRMPGFNFRFIAFSYEGELGIMLADPYKGAGFSIANAVVNNAGAYDLTATNVEFPSNVVSVFATGTQTAPDPLGFGSNNANIASPLFMNSYATPEVAQIPTKLFLPLKKNNYYVNGAEKDTLSLEVGQSLDGYGDGYWSATIISRTVYPGSRVATTYRVYEDLSTSRLAAGKTIVVQSLGSGTTNDFGRYTVQNISYSCGVLVPYTDIMVYDSVHATGISPATTSSSGTFAIYFNYDSVSFNDQNASDVDYHSTSNFKRFFEVYVDVVGKTFTQERGRMNVTGSNFNVNDSVPLRSTTGTSKFDLTYISPKLRGYQFGSVNKISLKLSFSSTTGAISATLSSYDGSTHTHSGLTVTGRQGTILRVYDETNIDYIEILLDANTTTSTFSNEIIDIQLYPSLELDEELMPLATCLIGPFNEYDAYIKYITDIRQFGNIGTKDLSTEALDFISETDGKLHANGIVRGFDLLNTNSDPNPNSAQIYLNGGVALVNGKLVQKNAETVSIPVIQESIGVSLYNINWALCVNDKNEYQAIPLLDYDPILGTPSTPNRTFSAYNLSSTTPTYYYLEASTFSNIINNRKDLTILYVVSSVITYISSPVITLTVNDARRFVNDVESNLPLNYNYATSQGNFKNIESIFNWLKYNRTYNGVVSIKGTATVSSDVYLDSTSSIVIDGQGIGSLTFSQSVNLGSNITFKNITLNFNGEIPITSGSSNLKFENCTIVLADSALVSNPAYFYIINANNVIFEDCTITAAFSVSRTAIYSVFYVSGTTDFRLINTSITSTFIPAFNPPGRIVVFNDSPQAIIKECVFSGNFLEGIYFNDTCDNFQIVDCSITSTFDPNTHAGTLGFDTSDLVNTGYGYIHGYASSTSSLDDVVIDKVNFNYNVASLYRYSFINIELSDSSSIINNMKITNCRFNHLLASSTIDDIRPAISIINLSSISFTYPDGGPTYAQPILQGLNISNNICNRNQSIIVTSTSQGSDGYMYLPALVPVNCCISNNVCGTIGYWTGTSTKYSNLSPNVNLSNDKTSNLVIENNTCHYITNTDHKGLYFRATKIIGSNTVDMCCYPSGNIIIRGNSANWIHTSITFEEESSIKILDNSLCAYDYAYLALFGDGASKVVGADYRSYAAIFVAGDIKKTATTIPGNTNDSCCIISGNTTNFGYYIQTNFVSITYGYYYSYIVCSVSNIISNNILKGIKSFTYSNLVSISGISNIITNNKIYRKSETIDYYIIFDSFEPNTWSGENSYGLVVDNYFDNYTCYTGDTSYVTGLYPTSSISHWIIERNINQTVTKKLRISSAKHEVYTNATGSMWALPSGVTAALFPSVYNYMQLSMNTSTIGNNHIDYALIHELTDIMPNNTTIVNASVSVTSSLTGTPFQYYVMITLIDSDGNIFTNSSNIFPSNTYTVSLSNDVSFIPTKIKYNGYATLIADVGIHDAAGTITATTNVYDVILKYRW